MMKRIWRTGMLALVFTATACSDDFFQVTDPDILESTAIDPVRDGPVLARSAYQNFADSFSQTAVYIAWWAYEARVGDTFPTRNEFGRRFLDDTNGTLNGDEIECNFHFGAFNVKTGQPTQPPCFVPLKTFKTEVRDGQVFVDLETPAPTAGTGS